MLMIFFEVVVLTFALWEAMADPAKTDPAKPPIISERESSFFIIFLNS